MPTPRGDTTPIPVTTTRRMRLLESRSGCVKAQRDAKLHPGSRGTAKKMAPPDRVGRPGRTQCRGSRRVGLAGSRPDSAVRHRRVAARERVAIRRARATRGAARSRISAASSRCSAQPMTSRSARGRVRSTHRRRAARRPARRPGRFRRQRPARERVADRRDRLGSRLALAADEGEIAAHREKLARPRSPTPQPLRTPPSPDRRSGRARRSRAPGEEVPVTTPADSEAGHSGSRAGYRTWATMTAGHPAARARRNGISSVRSSAAGAASTSGRATWESTGVRP